MGAGGSPAHTRIQGCTMGYQRAGQGCKTGGRVTQRGRGRGGVYSFFGRLWVGCETGGIMCTHWVGMEHLTSIAFHLPILHLLGFSIPFQHTAPAFPLPHCGWRTDAPPHPPQLLTALKPRNPRSTGGATDTPEWAPWAVDRGADFVLCASWSCWLRHWRGRLSTGE